MKKKSNHLQSFAQKLNAVQLIDKSKVAKIKGGGDPPPFGVEGDPPPFGIGN